MSTEAKNKSASHEQDEDHGSRSGSIVGIYTVGGGIILFALLIWFGL
ncbi:MULTISPECIES: hypothetical protein [unclassified Arthrobacter]|nr:MULTISPECIES: hypothetical protein [unclassified Arthrobacter]